jgi:hypothetical protein
MEIRRGRHSFIIGRKERHLLDELQVASHPSKGGRSSQGGHTFRVLVMFRV